MKIDFARVFSVIGTLLLCAGIVNAYLYYSFFNVPITNFLSISEVLILFADDIILYIIVFVIELLVFMIWKEAKGKPLAWKRKLLTYFKEKAIGNRLELYFLTWAYPIYLIWILSLVIFYFIDQAFFDLYSYVTLFHVGMFFANYIIIEYRRGLWLTSKFTKDDEPLLVGYELGRFFFLIVFAWTLYEVDDVRREMKYINVSFAVDGKTIQSDSTHFYIGNTDRYLFYYDKNQDKTTVYPMSRITQFNFGEIVNAKVIMREAEKRNKRKEWIQDSVEHVRDSLRHTTD
jgi:hypothetical protein